jgi:hypothetical protein
MNVPREFQPEQSIELHRPFDVCDAQDDEVEVGSVHFNNLTLAHSTVSSVRRLRLRDLVARTTSRSRKRQMLRYCMRNITLHIAPRPISTCKVCTFSGNFFSSILSASHATSIVKPVVAAHVAHLFKGVGHARCGVEKICRALSEEAIKFAGGRDSPTLEQRDRAGAGES